MNTEEYLKNLKTEYLKVEAPLSLRASGWETLSKQIGEQPVVRKMFWFERFVFVTGIVLIVVGGFFGFYSVASAALPGDPLYPLKRLSERVVEKATGDNQIVIDHRAQEIVNLSKEKEVNAQELQQTVAEYKQVVTETKQEIKQTGQTDQHFEKKLEEQHREFDRVVREAPSVRNEIKDAQEASNRED